MARSSKSTTKQSSNTESLDVANLNIDSSTLLFVIGGLLVTWRSFQIGWEWVFILFVGIVIPFLDIAKQFVTVINQVQKPKPSTQAYYGVYKTLEDNVKSMSSSILLFMNHICALVIYRILPIWFQNNISMLVLASYLCMNIFYHKPSETLTRCLSNDASLLLRMDHLDTLSNVCDQAVDFRSIGKSIEKQNVLGLIGQVYEKASVMFAKYTVNWEQHLKSMLDKSK